MQNKCKTNKSLSREFSTLERASLLAGVKVVHGGVDLPLDELGRQDRWLGVLLCARGVDREGDRGREEERDRVTE